MIFCRTLVTHDVCFPQKQTLRETTNKIDQSSGEVLKPSEIWCHELLLQPAKNESMMQMGWRTPVQLASDCIRPKNQRRSSTACRTSSWMRRSAHASAQVAAHLVRWRAPIIISKIHSVEWSSFSKHVVITLKTSVWFQQTFQDPSILSFESSFSR